MTAVAQVTEALCEHGEGPVWSASWGGLRWVDVLAGDMLTLRAGLDPDGSSSVVLDGVTISNGIAWSPDGATAYYVDTATHRIDAFDYSLATGLSSRRPLVTVDPGLGLPDGLTVDAAGCLWLALHDGGAVHRYRPDGKLDGRIEVPVRQVTACTFGGAALDQLYITTSRLGAGPDAGPAAGAVFRADVRVTGLPAGTFAG